MNLNIKATAVAFGLLWGIGVLLLVWFSLFFNMSPDLINFLGKYYIGLNVSFLGSLIGLIWGFIDGAFGGMAFAWLYNKLNNVL